MAASSRGRTATREGNSLASIGHRLDYLERSLADLNPQTSGRAVTRMTELERLTRDNCSALLTITLKREEEIDTKLKFCEAMVLRAEKVAGQGEERLKKRGDAERRETTRTLGELKGALDAIDEKVSKALDTIQEIETRCERLLHQAENQVERCVEQTSDATHRCEQVESLVSSLQAKDTCEDTRNYLYCKARVVRDARSPSLSSKTLPSLIQRAQSVASLRARSLDVCRHSSHGSRYERPTTPRSTSTLPRTNSWSSALMPSAPP